MVLDLEVTEIQNQVQRIVQSKAFRTSELHRNLFNYLAEKSLAGLGDSLKEYTVGLDVFAKPSSYDPRQESVVRMHVARLRQRLTEYYHTEGASDPILIDLPKGGFKMTFEPRQVAPEPDPAAPALAPENPRQSFWPKRALTLAGCLVLLAGTALLIEWRRSDTVQAKVSAAASNADAGAGWTPELQQLWSPILATNRPLMVCLATLHASQPPQALTGAGTASGAFLLGQFLGQRKQNILLTTSDLLSMPEVAMDNVVFVGPVAGDRKIEAIPVAQQIVLETGGIRNLNPKPGEPAFLADAPKPQNQEVATTYALVSHMPGLYGRGEILFLSGNHISSVLAAVQSLTDPNLARTLVARMRNAAGNLPRYYQIVLQVKSMDDMPVDISYVLHRELSLSKVASGLKSQAGN